MAFTFFFRDRHTLDQAINYLMPQVEGFRKIKIWDAGCAHGPEPYSLAILLAEKLGRFGFRKVEMDLTDIDENDTFGKNINEGIYPVEELKRIPDEIFKKYFKPADSNGHFIIDENIRSRVNFRKNDLLNLQPPDSGYHLIINKNVLLHLQYNQRIEVIRMFHRTLASNGFLVTEQTQTLPDPTAPLFTKVTSSANIFKKIG